jgi:hypothetical protein
MSWTRTSSFQLLCFGMIFTFVFLLSIGNCTCAVLVASYLTPSLGHAASVVQVSIDAAHFALSGERPTLPSQIFQSISLPIDSRVSAKVRAKIWNREYVDFGTLLGNPMLDEK